MKKSDFSTLFYTKSPRMDFAPCKEHGALKKPPKIWSNRTEN